MKTTTLNNIRKRCPYGESGWVKLLKHLGKTQADDEPLEYTTILDSNGLEDALWCCQCEPQYDKDWRLYAVWCARQVQHLMTDQRSINALDVAERYARGHATDEELAAERAAAWAAAWVAASAAARAAAQAAAWATTEAAAEAAAWAAAEAEAAEDAKREGQIEQFRKVCEGEL